MYHHFTQNGIIQQKIPPIFEGYFEKIDFLEPFALYTKNNSRKHNIFG